MSATPAAPGFSPPQPLQAPTQTPTPPCKRHSDPSPSLKKPTQTPAPPCKRPLRPQPPASAHSGPSPLQTPTQAPAPCKRLLRPQPLQLRHVNSSRQPAHTRSTGWNSAADEERKTPRKLVPYTDDHWLKLPFLPTQRQTLTQRGSGFSLYPEQLKAKPHYNVDLAMQI